MPATQIHGGNQIKAGTIPLANLVSGYSIPTANLVDGANFIKRDGSVAMTGALNMGSQKITSLGAPTAASDAVTKQYVDGLVNGLQLHEADVASTVNVPTLSGLISIDGVTVAAGDRVLLTAQTTGAQNGLWVAASGAWTRPPDYAAAAVLDDGHYVFVGPEGTANANSKWYCTTAGASITVDTTVTVWSRDQTGQITAGNGIIILSNAVSVDVDNVSIAISGNALNVVDDTTRLISKGLAGVGITNGTPGQLIVANASNKAAWATMSGDATLSNAGALSIVRTQGSGFVKYPDFVFHVTPTGLVNGSNVTYTLPATPWAGSVQLFLDGLLMEPGAGNDYTISGATITMLSAPPTGTKLRAFYMV